MFYYFHRSLAIFLACIPALAQKAAFPPETANQATGYMEWILDARFTAEQRQQYHEMLAGLDADRRAQIRSDKQPEFVHLLETASDERSRWLLSIHRAGRGGSTTPLGRWTDGHISAIQYKDATTGVSAPTNGRSFAYEFKPDGTYSFTGLMQSVMYSCTTTMFSNESGAYSVDGDSVSLRPEKNPYRMTNNCAPSSNRESPGKLVARTYRFRVVIEGGYLELCGDDGAVQKFGASR